MLAELFLRGTPPISKPNKHVYITFDYHFKLQLPFAIFSHPTSHTKPKAPSPPPTLAPPQVACAADRSKAVVLVSVLHCCFVVSQQNVSIFVLCCAWLLSVFWRSYPVPLSGVALGSPQAPEQQHPQWQWFFPSLFSVFLAGFLSEV